MYMSRRAPARLAERWRLMQVACAFLVVTAMLGSAAVLAQTDAGSEVAPAEAVDAVPVAAPETVPPSLRADQTAEPAAASESVPQDEAAPGTQPLADSAPPPDHDRASPVAAVPATSETHPVTTPVAPLAAPARPPGVQHTRLRARPAARRSGARVRSPRAGRRIAQPIQFYLAERGN
jgi:hypothetical protein